MVEAASIAEAQEKLRALGFMTPELRTAYTEKVEHVLTHRELHVAVAVGEAGARARAPAAIGAPYERAAFLNPEAAEIGVSTLARKVLAAAAGMLDTQKSSVISCQSHSHGRA